MTTEIAYKSSYLSPVATADGTGRLLRNDLSLQHDTGAMPGEGTRYEINLEEDEFGRDRGVVIVQSAYFESASDTRREGELRQGDRVRLLTAHQGARGTHEAGKTGTVFTTHVRPGSILHDVALDFSENIRVSPGQLERLSEGPATVTFGDDGGMHVSFG